MNIPIRGKLVKRRSEEESAPSISIVSNRKAKALKQ